MAVQSFIYNILLLVEVNPEEGAIAISAVVTGQRRVFRTAAPVGALRIKGWTWADWAIGRRQQLYGTLTITAAGNARFACVTATDDVAGAEPGRAGFSRETHDGVSLHAEAPHDGPTIRERDRARCGWAFDFTYEASNFDRITGGADHDPLSLEMLGSTRQRRGAATEQR